MRFPTLAWLALLACSMLAGAAFAQARVAAAADLKFALPELVGAFERAGGGKLQVSFGSSGNFRRQIGEGAPFELFFSADEAYADALIGDGRAQAPGVVYGIGRIVLFVPGGSKVRPDPALKDAIAAASDGRLTKFAIANPEHAPYGQAARFASSGAAQAGILPLALMQAPELSNQGAHVLLPDTLHAPLRQKAVLIQGAGETARRFLEFVRSPAGVEILARHGFAVPR